MFSSNFYPTPESLIDKMVQHINLRLPSAVLEPSAGKGNITDRIFKELKSMGNRWEDLNVEKEEKK